MGGAQMRAREQSEVEKCGNDAATIAARLLAQAGAQPCESLATCAGALWTLGRAGGDASLWLLDVTDGTCVFELAGTLRADEPDGISFREHDEGALASVSCHAEGRSAGVVLTRRGLQRAAIRLQLDPTALERALRDLGRGPADAALEHTLLDISRTRPGRDVARAFYRARTLEMLALAADADARRRQRCLEELGEDDRTALARARACIGENLDRSVAADELCDVARLSAGRLTRLFRHVEGETPQEYARRVRMTRARELLETSTMPMADVSRRLGFSRQGSFSEAFKARYGMTPHEYRTLCQTPSLV